MKQLSIVILVVIVLINAVPALAQDPSNANDIIPMGNCLNGLDVSQAQVGYYTNRASRWGQASFANPLQAGEFEAFSSLQVRNIWLGYGNVSERGYEASDWPKGPANIVYEWLNLTSTVTGDAMRIWVMWSEITPDEYYIFPMKNDDHGGGGCRFYSVGVEDFWTVMGGFGPA